MDSSGNLQAVIKGLSERMVRLDFLCDLILIDIYKANV
jgi:hypothetical protein